MLILSGDIRDQSRKLSKIAKNFGRFFSRFTYGSYGKTLPGDLKFRTA